eukprot:m.308791 g.308791  ORF g.308791 m.308791 type:complete len:55 (-) comp20192_c0_seq3:21-185(-)
MKKTELPLQVLASCIQIIESDFDTMTIKVVHHLLYPRVEVCLAQWNFVVVNLVG